MGGEISLNLTYLYPEAVTHLILTDATGGAHTLVNKQGSPKPQLSTDLHTVSAIADYDESKVKFKRNDEEHYNKMKLWPRRLQIHANEIQQPTLIIWGRNDSSVSWKEGETYHQFLKNSTFHIIEKGYHAPFRQEPQEFVGYVKEFFKTIRYKLKNNINGYLILRYPFSYIKQLAFGVLSFDPNTFGITKPSIPNLPAFIPETRRNIDKITISGFTPIDPLNI